MPEANRKLKVLFCVRVIRAEARWRRGGHAHETCPVFRGNAKVIHVGFDDPPKLSVDAKTEEEALNHYRRVRDEVRTFIQSLPEALQSVV